MFRKGFTAAAIAAMIAIPAHAAIDKVAEVTVSADIASIENAAAAAYWATLPEDLQAAIVGQLVGRTDASGSKINVDISEIELSSSFERAIGAADGVLVGSVKVDDPNNNQMYDDYQIIVTLGSAPMVSADGTQVVFSSLDEPQAYETLIQKFAEGVLLMLDQY
jgi:hypothetical protein